MSQRADDRRRAASRDRRHHRPLVEGVEARLLLSTFVVNNTGDSGAGTLRQAITDSNASPAPPGQSNRIDFEIGTGTQVIHPASALPVITETVAIDATVSAFGSRQVIELQGDLAGSGVYGLTIEGTGVVIKGLEIAEFGGPGILIVGGSGNVVASCEIGLGAQGTGNGGDGVAIVNSSNDLIGGTDPGDGNVISANGANGVEIADGSTGIVLAGNLIGTDVSGQVGLGNFRDGVYISHAAGNSIGGTAPGAGNVISANGLNGLEIVGEESTGEVVQGNLIGVDGGGFKGLGNLINGVLLNTSSNDTVGGRTSGAGNVISGNDGSGVVIVNARANLVEGNRIGTDFSAGFSVGNAQSGVVIGSGSNNTIGAGNVVEADGSITSFFGNILSGNGASGVSIEGGSSNVLIGNAIGTDITGTIGIANGSDGVMVNSSSGNTIGGVTPSTRNIISNNFKDGISTNGERGDLIEGNYIGTDATGALDEGNVNNGVSIIDGIDNIVGGIAIGSGNLILGNGGAGVSLTTSSINTIQGNRIGLNIRDFTLAFNFDGSKHQVGNDQDGISLNVGSSNNLIGGPVSEARNVISGNLKAGISIVNNSDGNLIQGNYVGLDSTGTAGRGNRLNGIYITTSGNTVGGGVPGSMNVVSGNLNSGVVLSGFGATGNLVSGNLIGTDVSGGLGEIDPGAGADFLPIGNREDGVFINDDAVNNTVGGTKPLDRNVISGNGSNGIQILDISINANPIPPGNVVVGNYIGTDASGLAPDGNAAAGVFLYRGRANIIGAPEVGGGNVISGNLGSGVAIQGESATDNLVLSNMIGTNAMGTVMLVFGLNPLANEGNGVSVIDAAGNQIGGIGAGEGNLISGNSGDGVSISSGSNSTTVAGNKIGVDSSGENAVGNRLDGVRVANAGFGTLVVSNLIAASSGAGVEVAGFSSTAVIQKNFIGLDALGEQAFRNGVGVLIDGVPNIVVGGLVPGTGNTISGNGVGIEILPANDTSLALNDLIVGNIIGLNASGTKAVGNGFGIFLNDSVGVTIGGTTPEAQNVISGNSGIGVQVFRVSPHGSGDLIQGNIIGLNSIGLASPIGAFQEIGVFINSASNNTVGGTVAGARNVISGNFTSDPNRPSFGISIFGESIGEPLNNRVEGNLIGTDAFGGLVLGPGRTPFQTVGVAINTSAGNTIGGTVPLSRNTISSNEIGVQVAGIVSPLKGQPHGNVIIGDTIDANAFGVFINAALGNIIVGDDLSLNTSIGVAIDDVMASDDMAKRNVVSGNRIFGNGSPASIPPAGSTVGDGVFIDSSTGNTITGNMIQTTGVVGKNPTGVGRSNRTGVGVFIFDHSSDNLVAGNTIQGSTAYGILVFNSAINLSTIPRTGPTQNTIGGSGIANFREFTGAVLTPTSRSNSGVKTQEIVTPKGPRSFQPRRAR